MDFLIAGLGLVILLLAGDVLVRGAVNLALRLGIPALLVSLTIVAFGTSAPELLIAVDAVLEGAPGLAIGNVVGSNTANVLLVLGVPALVAGLAASQTNTRESYNFMLAGTLLFMALCFFGPLTWWHGAILMVFLTFYLLRTARDALAHRSGAVAAPEEELEGVDPKMRGWKIALFLALGLIGLPLGAHLLVDSSTSIARSFGVSETVIGLTLVAVGTSLPELATTVMAALRREADVALGNVIGSNMFNLTAIIGIAAFVGPIPVPASFLSFDLWVMLGCSILIAPIVYKNLAMGRTFGIVLTLGYLGYIVSVLL